MSADRWFGLAITLVSLGMVAEVLQIAAPFGALGDPGPRIVPLILAGGLAVLGLVLLCRPKRVIVLPKGGEGTEEAPAAGVDILPPPAPPVRIALTVAFLAYVFFFERLGFTIATFLFLSAAIVLLGRWTPRAAAVAIAVAAVTTLAVGAFLHGAIGIPLPGVLVF